MPLGWVAAAAAVVGGVEGIENGSKARGVASQEQYQSATIFGEQQSFEAQLMELMATPDVITSLPGYKFNLDQGSENLSRQMAAQGLRGSGNQLAALQSYGENYAMNSFNQQASLLASLSGITAASSPSQALGSAGQTLNTANQQSAASLNSTFSQLGLLAGRFGGLSTPSTPAGTPASTSASSSTTVPTWGPPS